MVPCHYQGYWVVLDSIPEAALQGPHLMLGPSNLVHTHTWLLSLFEYQALQP